jgi:WD40 repeat protein
VADLFISYSRRDQAFVRRFAQGMSDRGREVWVDWRDIPPTAMWMEEVRGAIVSANAFVFVISPDSVASPICRKEIEAAVDCNKRFIPILLRPVNGQEIPEPAASHNWISFEDAAAFDAAVEQVVRALDIDLDWLHAHTRYLVRAREWDQNGRDRSYILRGRDLQSAQRWLGEAAGQKDPEPTPLQAQYIVASQRAAAHGQRVRVGALATGLAVTVLLAMFAVSQRNNAVRQAKLAQSRELAASSVSELHVDPELSLLLAMEAWRRTATFQAGEALRRALQASRVRRTLRGPPDTVVHSAEYSPDGAHVLVAYADGTCWLWDLTASTPTHKVFGTPTANDAVHTARFDGDGRRMVTATQDGAAVVWDVETGARVATLKANTEPLNAASLSSDGTRVVTAGDDDIARIWDLATGVSRELARHTQPINDARFSPDGAKVVTASSDDTAIIWDASSGRPLLAPLRGADKLNSAAFSPDGDWVITTNRDGTAQIYDAREGHPMRSLTGHTDSVMSAAYSEDGRWIVTSSSDRTARVWDASTGRQLLVLRGHSKKVTDAEFSPDGKTVVTAGEDVTTRVWDVTAGQPVTKLNSRSGQVMSARYDSTGTTVVTATQDGRVILWQSGGTSKQLLKIDNPVDSAWFSPDGKRVVTTSMDGLGRVVVVDTGKVVTMNGKGTDVDSASFSPDGLRVVAVTQHEKARVWDADSGRPVFSLPVSAKDAVFSRDGKSILTASQDGKVRIWDVGTKRLVETISVSEEPLDVVRFNEAGTRFVAVGEDGAAQVWDWATSSRLVTFATQGGTLTDAEFNPDGTRLVTANTDGTATIWAVNTGRLVETIRRPGQVYGASFSPADGTGPPQILVVSNGAMPGVYDCDLCVDDLFALAGRRVTRQLTLAERERFLHGSGS